ncbi:DUF3888 domain-containing protein [Sutcliffiella horikoshii]|uniref:DUF3888 domain-containing protein n=1 Tax=Sutcliffiella horikoshii TaxID=79883 RepID=UPI001F359117|nr:DUF3888 domain-containing protein [Sutcliffiella horikoshii]
MIVMLILVFAMIPNTSGNAKTINEADTELCDTFKYALINSVREPVDKAIFEIYKEDKNAPKGLTWASYDKEILKIKQVYGMGELYEITLKVYPYYLAHISYGVVEVVIHTLGELLGYKHLKTFPEGEG